LTSAGWLGRSVSDAHANQLKENLKQGKPFGLHGGFRIPQIPDREAPP
jgi:hypothetical protein